MLELLLLYLHLNVSFALMIVGFDDPKIGTKQLSYGEMIAICLLCPYAILIHGLIMSIDSWTTDD